MNSCRFWRARVKHSLQRANVHIYANYTFFMFSGYGAAKPRKIAYKPPDETALEEAREYRMMELKMYDILRELAFYVTFLCILLFIGYGLRDHNAHLLKDQLGHVFVDKGYETTASSPATDFKKVSLERHLRYAMFYNKFAIPHNIMTINRKILSPRTGSFVFVSCLHMCAKYHRILSQFEEMFQYRPGYTKWLAFCWNKFELKGMVDSRLIWLISSIKGVLPFQYNAKRWPINKMKIRGCLLEVG